MRFQQTALTSVVKIAGLLLATQFAGSSFAATDPYTEQMFQTAVVMLKTQRAMMRDPASFRYNQVGYVNGGIICITYTGKNGFGGYAALEPLVYDTVKKVGGSGKSAIPLYKKLCAGKTMTEDFTSYIHHAL